MATPWNFTLQIEPDDDQECWIRNGWQTPAVHAIYDEDDKVFTLEDGRELPWYFVWKWQPYA